MSANDHKIYIQTRKVKRLHLTIGGHAYLLPNTSLVIKCPVKVFPKAYIMWRKDGRPLPSSKRLDVTKFRSLKIHSLGPEDIGVYECIAGPASDIFTLQLIGSHSRPPVANTYNDIEFRGAVCYSHNNHVRDGHPLGVISGVYLLPPGDQEVSLHPKLEERLINITLQADRREIRQEQASELISSLLTHMFAQKLWTRPAHVKGNYDLSCSSYELSSHHLFCVCHRIC